MPDRRIVPPLYDRLSRFLIQVGIQYGEVLSEMDWQFIHSPEDQLFITSDNPVICETGDPNNPRAVHMRSGPNLLNAAAPG